MAHCNCCDAWRKEKLERGRVEDEMIELIETMRESGEQRISGIVVLEIVLRRESPLHKLWQKLHLEKYPRDL